MEHDWNKCKCIKCGSIKDGQHEWNGCKCSICGVPSPEEYHEWDGCICKICNHTRHEWLDDCILAPGQLSESYLWGRCGEMEIQRRWGTILEIERIYNEARKDGKIPCYEVSTTLERWERHQFEEHENYHNIFLSAIKNKLLENRMDMFYALLCEYMPSATIAQLKDLLTRKDEWFERLLHQFFTQYETGDPADARKMAEIICEINPYVNVNMWFQLRKNAEKLLGEE